MRERRNDQTIHLDSNGVVVTYHEGRVWHTLDIKNGRLFALDIQTLIARALQQQKIKEEKDLYVPPDIFNSGQSRGRDAQGGYSRRAGTGKYG